MRRGGVGHHETIRVGIQRLLTRRGVIHVVRLTHAVHPRRPFPVVSNQPLVQRLPAGATVLAATQKGMRGALLATRTSGPLDGRHQSTVTSIAFRISATALWLRLILHRQDPTRATTVLDANDSTVGPSTHGETHQRLPQFVNGYGRSVRAIRPY